MSPEIKCTQSWGMDQIAKRVSLEEIKSKTQTIQMKGFIYLQKICLVLLVSPSLNLLPCHYCAK